jgi:hypothetical protein
MGKAAALPYQIKGAWKEARDIALHEPAVADA